MIIQTIDEKGVNDHEKPLTYKSIGHKFAVMLYLPSTVLDNMQKHIKLLI